MTQTNQRFRLKNKTMTKSQTAAKINTFRLAFQTGSAYSTLGTPGVKKKQTENDGNIFTLQAATNHAYPTTADWKNRKYVFCEKNLCFCLMKEVGCQRVVDSTGQYSKGSRILILSGPLQTKII